MKNQRYVLIVSVLLLISLSLCGCNKSEETGEVVRIDVEAVYPVQKDISLSGNFIGTIEAGRKIPITPQISGVVTSKLHKAGDHVKKGDVLFTIDDTEWRLAKNNAEANIRSAEITLQAQQARNEETKTSVNESLATMNSRSLELANNISSSEREAYAAAARKDAYCRDSGIYRDEAKRIDELKNDAQNRADSAKRFTDHLKGYKNIYHEIASSSDPVSTAKKYGLSDAEIGTEKDAAAIALIYLNTKTQYESPDQLQTAIDASSEAERSAASEKNELNSSSAANTASRIEAELNAMLEAGNIAGAQEAKALAQKLSTDYELFTKATMLADAQAKLREGDAAVASSDVQLISAKNELEAANLKLGYATVCSPIDGMIQEDNIEQFVLRSDARIYHLFRKRKKSCFLCRGGCKEQSR